MPTLSLCSINFSKETTTYDWNLFHKTMQRKISHDQLKMSNREAYVIPEENIVTYLRHFQQKLDHKAFKTTQILIHGRISENAGFTVNQLLI